MKNRIYLLLAIHGPITTIIPGVNFITCQGIGVPQEI